jgi:isoleucyl-tRNA synthetase
MATIDKIPEDKTYCAYNDIILEMWKDIGLYDLLVNQEKDRTEVFQFQDGPPFVSGNLHLGHAGVGMLKDAIQRDRHMKGKRVVREIGFDVHGVPSENKVSQLLNIKTKKDMDAIGIPEFNRNCKEYIASCSGSWKPICEVIGRLADFDNSYSTMDVKFMESVWWCFKQLWDKNLIFQAYRIMPYSYGCQTPISNFEAGENYKEITTKSAYVWFKLKDYDNRGFVAWTTTPWTLPCNLALCVNPDIMYVLCKCDDGNEYIVGESSVKNIGKTITSVEPYGKGITLVGLEYKPLFSYVDYEYHKVISDNYVKDSPDIGTSIVHIAPAFGEDDCRICINAGVITTEKLNIVCPVDEDGCYTSVMLDLTGLLVFDADEPILKKLYDDKLLVKTQRYHHQYPFCGRTDTPLIYMASLCYFIDVPLIKDDMIRLNDTINWHPSEIGSGRFKSWLENVKPWCVSRNRYFGTPLPIWISEDSSESICIGSIDELNTFAKLSTDLTDLHPEYVNDITFKHNEKIFRRVPFVFDCWFESGAVPYAHIHYPFENKDMIDDRDDFLCDFIAEGLDQTRGWFYTLLVLSTAISNKAPFKNVICTGLIMDEHGEKFSKKKGNCVDPSDVIKKYGSDIMRLYLLSSPIVHADPLFYSDDQVGQMKKKIIPYINGVMFFHEHYINFSKSHSTIVADVNDLSLNVLDKWILEKVTVLKQYVMTSMDNFLVNKAVDAIVSFIEDLTNWYIKLSRDRLKGLCGLTDWLTSLSTLYAVLMDYIVLSSPFMPFLSEYLFMYLKRIDPVKFNTVSVHQLAYPASQHVYNIVDKFDQLQSVTVMLRSIRDGSKTHTSIKTPIANCTIYHHDPTYLTSLSKLIDIIKTEVNVLQFDFTVLDDSMNYFQVKINAKTVGQTFLKQSKNVRSLLENLNQAQLKTFYDEFARNCYACIVLQNESNIFVITHEHIDVKTVRNVSSAPNIQYKESSNILISVDLTYDQYVHDIGQINLFISDVQMTRKLLGLRPWNKIQLYVDQYCANDVSIMINKCITIIKGRINTDVVYESFEFVEASDVYCIKVHTYENIVHELRYKIKVI